MTIRKAIVVLDNGEMGELPAGDILDGVDGEVIIDEEIDFITDNLFYIGEAAVGSSFADPVWRIRRVTIGGDGDVSKKHADGVGTNTKIWDDRLTYTY